MIRRLFFFLASVALLLSGACTHYYYAPNTLQTPFLQKQHDARVGFGQIAGDEFSGYELHATYSPLKHAAIMVNHMYVAGDDNSADESGKGRLSEIALGAYAPAGRYSSFSFFGGWGGGKVVNTYASGGRSDLRFERIFIQPTYAFQARWVRLGAAIRLNRLRYTRGDIDLEIGEPDVTFIRNIERDSPLFIPETNFSCGFGHGPFWGDFSLNLGNFMDTYDPGEYSFANATFSVAFNCQLDYFWRPKAVAPENR